jgi:hypothetical protein
MSNSSNQSGSGNYDSHGNRGSAQWESGGQGTSGWDTACFISPSTTSFVLLTNDGRQVRLDDASNSMVQQKLQSTNRVSGKSKIFRVRVSGDMTGDSVHVNDIQM